MDPLRWFWRKASGAKVVPSAPDPRDPSAPRLSSPPPSDALPPLLARPSVIAGYQETASAVVVWGGGVRQRIITLGAVLYVGPAYPRSPREAHTVPKQATLRSPTYNTEARAPALYYLSIHPHFNELSARAPRRSSARTTHRWYRWLFLVRRPDRPGPLTLVSAHVASCASSTATMYRIHGS